MVNGMRILVAAASKHGATAEIADRIGDVLQARDLDVTVAEPDDAAITEDYDAVVLGSAVYTGHWLAAASDLAHEIAARRPRPVVWLFSSGPVGDPPLPDEEPVDVAEIADALSPREHRIFAGKLDKSRLGFGERAIMVAVRAPEGDFRNWGDITAWAEGIADELEH